MPTPSAKQRLLLAIALVLLLSVVALVTPRSGLPVTVLDQRLRVLTAKISHGTTHEVFFGRWHEGDLREQLHRWGLKVQRFGGVRCITEKDSYAFVLRYTGRFTRNELDGVKAEIVDDSGAASPLQGASESYSAAKNEFARIWVLEPPPTRPATLRLTLATSGLRLAEVGLRGQNVR